jgi:cellulose synthase/poly-beta-1,6-N-acetylglucosamine synthase-like glycosyltransferase
MSFVLAVLFWVSVFAIFYAYFGYPLLLMILPERKSTDSKNSNSHPKVTLIITAYNEAGKIEEKLRNALELSYPSELLEIIVASDASSDGTHERVLSFEDKGIRLVRLPIRKGKEHAQAEAVSEAKGEILVFSDVATFLPRDTIRQFVASFEDPEIGCVSSEDVFLDNPESKSGEGIYVKYLMWLRKLETQSGSVVGLSGSLFATRKEVARGLRGDLQSDFYMALRAVSMGYRAVSNPAIKGYYKDIRSGIKEFDRKVRTVNRGLTVFFKNLSLLDPFKYKFFSVRLFSHKMMRWLIPFLLMVSFFSSLLLSPNSLSYFALWGIQAIFYFLALLGYFLPFFKKTFFVRIPFYFSLVNLSILVAWFQFIAGKRIVMWEPSRR